MSGSGGGGSSGGGFVSEEIDCKNLVITTQLSSPKEEVIKKISVGDVLMLALDTSQSNVSVVALHNGKVAGGIASPKLMVLRQCMEKGLSFIAIVLDVTLAQVQVRIKIDS